MPELEEKFGVRSGDLKVYVDLSSPTEERGASTGPGGITLFGKALPWLSGVFAHETVHWLVHWRHSYWNTLPIAVEEGLAQLAFHEYSGEPVPTVEYHSFDVVPVLALSHEEFKALESVRPATYAGCHIAELIGLDGLRELAQRAWIDGYRTIPAQWILEAMAEVGRTSEP